MASPTLALATQATASAPLDSISTFSSCVVAWTVEPEPGGMEAAEVAAVVGMVAECLDAEDYDEHEGITEESVAEVMSWFELEIKLAAGANALPLPPPPALYATVSERKESCGPSLSVPASTVMASVDGRAGAPPPLAEPWPCTWPVPEPAAEEEDVDDEWVLQFLTDGPPVEEQHGGQY